MAVAWIAYRDLGEVRNWWAAYWTEFSDWTYRKWRVGFDGPIYEGWLLDERRRPTLALLGIASPYRGDDDDGEPN